MTKNIITVALILTTLNAFTGNALKYVPENADFVISVYPDKVFEISELKEILDNNPDYLLFKWDLEFKGIDFEKSFTELAIAGKRGEKSNNVIIAETNIPEQKMKELLIERGPLDSTMAGVRKVYKIVREKKTTYMSYLDKNILTLSENYNVIAKPEANDIRTLLKNKFGINEKPGRNIIEIYSKGLEFSGKKRNHNNSRKNMLQANMIEELVIFAKSDDCQRIDVEGKFFSKDKSNSKIVRFQVNTLFLLFAAQLSKSNEALANEIVDSFKISSDGNCVLAKVSVDSVKLKDIMDKKGGLKPEFQDPFSGKKNNGINEEDPFK